MSSINEPLTISPIPIDTIIRGYKVSHILLTAIEKGVFNRLSVPKSAKDIAREIGTDPGTTEKFLNVLVTLGLLAKSDNKYINTTDAETFLVKGRSHYIGNYVRINTGINRLFSYLDEVLENVVSVQEPSEVYVFNDFFIPGQVEGALYQELPLIFDTLKHVMEFTNAKRILDLGGAHGAYSVGFAQKDPVLQVTLFDRPHMIGFAKELIAKQGMKGKIKLMAGDFNTDDIGNGYDLSFVSHVLYQKEGIEPLLCKIYDSLDNNGAVVLNHWIIDENRTSPRKSVLFDLYASIMDRDYHCYTVNEYTDLLEKTGFSKVRIFDIQTTSSPSMLILGKKEV